MTYANAGSRENRQRKARERAPKVWPPEKSSPEPVGRDKACQFIDSLLSRNNEIEDRFYIEDDPAILSHGTASPELYTLQAIKGRLIEFFSKLPRDFFEIFLAERRKISLLIEPGNDLTGRSCDTIPKGGVDSRSYSIALRQSAIEAETETIF